MPYVEFEPKHKVPDLNSNACHQWWCNICYITFQRNMYQEEYVCMRKDENALYRFMWDQYLPAWSEQNRYEISDAYPFLLVGFPFKSQWTAHKKCDSKHSFCVYQITHGNESSLRDVVCKTSVLLSPKAVALCDI